MGGLEAGRASTGGVVSTTVTVRLFCALVLPQASTACQVTVSVGRASCRARVEISVVGASLETQHASDAVGAVKLGVAGHSMVASAAGLASTGGVVASTVTDRQICGLKLPQQTTTYPVTFSE